MTLIIGYLILCYSSGLQFSAFHKEERHLIKLSRWQITKNNLDDVLPCNLGYITEKNPKNWVLFYNKTLLLPFTFLGEELLSNYLPNHTFSIDADSCIFIPGYMGRKALLVSWRAGIPLQFYILGLLMVHQYLQYIYAVLRNCVEVSNTQNLMIT